MSADPSLAAPATVQDYMDQPPHPAYAVVRYSAEPSQVAEPLLPNAIRPPPSAVQLAGCVLLEEFEGLAQTSALAADLAGRGYAVWNVDSRKLGEPGAGYPGTFQDVAVAVDRLREEAPKHALDLSRIVVLGHSAGGHLALWV